MRKLKLTFLIISLMLLGGSSLTASKLYYPIISTSIVAKVSAKKIPLSIASLVLQNAIDNSISLGPGMRVDINEQYMTDIDLGDSDSKEVVVPVNISSSGIIKQAFTLKVLVKYQAIVFDDTVDRLFVSNNPEEVLHSGILLKDKIADGETVKLILYHKNASEKYQDVLLAVTNSESHPVEIHIVAGFGGPNEDGLFVGHLATKRYLKYMQKNQGVFITIPPKSTRIVYKNPAKNNQVVSGIFRIRKITDGQISLATMMINDDSSSVIQYITHDKENKGHVGGVFTGGYRTIKSEYVTGDDILNLRIGDEPFLRDDMNDLVLKGNYGLTYKLDIKLVNKFNSKRKVNLFFVPSGGIARGIFLFRDKMIETGLLNPIYWDDMSKIISIDMNSRETKHVSVLTMPQPGSFYPVNVVLNTEQ